MTVREILVYPDKRLLVTANPVKLEADGKFSPEIVAFCEDLKETVKAFDAEGLAATQVGSDHRIFIIRSKDNSDYTICVNPEIVDTIMTMPGKKTVEGCLSFPSVNELITRFPEINVKYLTETGEQREETLTGVRCVAFQHELDHLNGKLFVERMGTAQKYLAIKKLNKLKQKVNRRFKTHLESVNPSQKT